MITKWHNDRYLTFYICFKNYPNLSKNDKRILWEIYEAVQRVIDKGIPLKTRLFVNKTNGGIFDR